MAEAVLSRRALNRSLLARQMLDTRVKMPAAKAIEKLVGMQAQEPRDPYIGLWTRLQEFDPHELSQLLSKRKAVRATMMRATIHLMTKRDYLALRTLMQPIVQRQFTTRLVGLGPNDIEEVAAMARKVLIEPHGYSELRKKLAEHWRDRDAESMARSVLSVLALIQPTPRGLWNETGRSMLTTSEAWLGRAPSSKPSISQLVLRYLAAFGPASVADMANWSRLTGLRQAFEKLRPKLRTFRDENGRELFDVADAPFPDPETSVPVRFLPIYDNCVLTLRIDGKLSKRERAAMAQEAEALLSFLVEDAPTLGIEFVA